MNNSVFISRCEVILTTMRASNLSGITTKQVATWLNTEEYNAAAVLAKMCSINLLKKTGAARSTGYVITDACKNSILSQSVNKSESETISYVVNWYLNHKTTQEVKQVTTADGRKLIKIESREKLNEDSKHAIDTLILIIKDNENLRVENASLREEVKRLKEVEDKYKQIKSLMK